ncbi:MAG: glycoside hydrolase family 3 N-terminal domain-containing protein [Eubacteriales bacterium]|nr:glycoside hydrolase family 3 N-terminal domain-containing protein [Eubacteriales bacterium]
MNSLMTTLANMGVNLDDVADVVSNCVPQLILLGLVALIVIVALIVLAVNKKMSRPAKFIARVQAGLAMLLALIITINLVAFGPMNTMLDLVTGNGTISEASGEEANALCTEIAEEGIVLLQNDNATLPLASGSNLNVFGWASVGPVYGGTGAGAISADRPTVSLLEGLQNSGINTNTELSDFYTAYCAERPALGYSDHNWTLPEPTASSYTQEMIDNAKAFSDTALVVISRVGGEFADLPTDMSTVNYTDNSTEYKDFEDGQHYLSLNKTEQDMVDLVCSNFDKVILVYNAANTMELGFVDDYPQIQSVLWCPGTGQTGFNGLGEIVAGAVNPSGHSADTFVYDLTATPYFNNIGEFEYTNADAVSYESAGLFGGDAVTVPPHFVNYVEGIYVGYKFYETADAEGLIDYDSTVQYPFGHGLSYTTFAQTIDSMTEEGGVITMTVTVTNTGSVAGKDAVQVYYNPPYTNGGIEKASANLVTFAKTGDIEPGASETVTLTFDAEDMASFDNYGEGCYVLEEGDYVISINEDSHTVLDSETYTVADTVVYDESNPRSTDEVAATSKFDFAQGEYEVLSRADHFANYAEAVAAPTSYELPEEAMATLYNDHNWNPEDFNNPDDVMPVTGADNGLKLADLRGADYDDERWELLLDQMTVAEMDDMIALGGYQTKAEASVDKYATIDCDGPASINNNFTGVSSIGFPSEIIIASTFNVDLARRYGESIGRMASEMNVTGWYAPAMNAHRSAFDGRNFEYYSEDSVLSGYIGAYSIAGAQSYGVYAYMKHFALNDQQIAQSEMLCTWADEQAIREIYLRPFELSVKIGDCKAVMSSWNYIGNQWAGACSALLNDVLRSEWGFRGMVITDGFHFTDYMDSDIAIRNGCDLMLKNYDVATNHLTDTTSATSILAMRQASKNIMYTVVNSRVYDPSNVATTPVWRTAMIAADVVLGILIVGLEVLAVRSYKKKKKAQA